jgi:hypothetical protein
VGANVGGSEKSKNRRGSQNTRVWNESTRVTKNYETKNLRKSALASKVLNPFTRALAPLLWGDEGSFTFRKYPRI